MKIIPTENFPSNFWEYNYPVQFWTDEDTGDVSYTIYMPRKSACWESDDFIPKEELNQVIDNSIIKLKEAIGLMEKFKKGEVDHVYYWDLKQ